MQLFEPRNLRGRACSRDISADEYARARACDGVR